MFKKPATHVGFAINLPSAATASQSPQWRDITGAATVGATVVGTRAEISWSGNSPPRIDYALLASDGHKLARVTIDELGSATLVTAPGMSGWPWIGIERPPADDAKQTAAEWTARLEWQLLSGAPAPTTWRRNDHWLDNHGHRIELITSERETGLSPHAVALVDRITDWAIVSSIEQALEFSEANFRMP